MLVLYGQPYTEKTVPLNERNISLIYGQRKNFFQIKKEKKIKEC